MDALNKLRGTCIRNATGFKFPSREPSINSTEYHIEIYKLVREYVELAEDLEKKPSQSTRGFIEKRMEEISDLLVSKYWIAVRE